MIVKEIVPAEIKADVEARVITAYVSTFGFWDLHNHNVERGAYAKTIAEGMPRNRIKARFQHRHPIGRPTHLEEDSKGLLSVTQISDTPTGREVVTLAADGVVDRASVGINIVKSEEVEREGGRWGMIIKEARLFEYSFTDLAVNEDAQVISVKAWEGMMAALSDPDGAREYLKSQGVGTREELAAWMKRLEERAVTALQLTEPPQPGDEPTEKETGAKGTDKAEPEALNALHSSILEMRKALRLDDQPEAIQ